MATDFITTNIAHRDCVKCANSAEAARTLAKVTGSVGSTHKDGTHFATVRRADRMHDYDPSDDEVKFSFYNVNEVGTVYDKYDSFDSALAVLKEFPNDTIVTVIAGSPGDLAYGGRLGS